MIDHKRKFSNAASHTAGLESRYRFYVPFIGFATHTLEVTYRFK